MRNPAEVPTCRPSSGLLRQTLGDRLAALRSSFGAANLSANVAAAERPPNVIIIRTDDHGAAALGACGTTDLATRSYAA